MKFTPFPDGLRLALGFALVLGLLLGAALLGGIEFNNIYARGCGLLTAVCVAALLSGAIDSQLRAPAFKVPAVAPARSDADGMAESAKRVANIASLVDGIAFETSILALNTAVEVARDERRRARRRTRVDVSSKELIAAAIARADGRARMVEQTMAAAAALQAQAVRLGQAIEPLRRALRHEQAQARRGARPVLRLVHSGVPARRRVAS